MIGFTIICILHTEILPIIAFFHEPSSIPIRTKTSLRNDSFFGYSMAYDDKALLIGAPAADRFGKVFEFNLADTKAKETEILSPLAKDEYSKYDWFGATIKTYGPGSFVICAPRKVVPSIDVKHPDMKITFGKCFILDSEKKFTQLADDGLDRKIFNSGMDAFGWTVDIDNSSNIWIASSVIPKNVIKIYDELTGLTTTRLLPFNASMYNFGYSIVSGNFLSDTESCHAVSSTYGVNGQGKIFFFTREPFGKLFKYTTAMFELNSTYYETDGNEESETDSIGSTYGAAMCRAHLGGERASLLVGAPTYAKKHEDYDKGAVYLYVPNEYKLSSKSLIFKRKIEGERDAGQFGYAIVSAGDLDGDHKDEVVIGAPFEDGGRGAVYIYSGAALLSGGTWSQRIPGESQSFGFTLLPLPDYTGNGLNGLSVGAPLEDTVYLFRPVPFITVDLDTVLPNTQILREDPNCINFTVVINVAYPKLPENISTRMEIKLKIIHPDANLENAVDGVVKEALLLDTKRQTLKKTFKILTPRNGNYGVSLEYVVSVELVDEPEADGKLKDSRVFLSERSVVSKQGEVWISDCKRGVCLPDFTVTMYPMFNVPYTVGSSHKEYVSLIVHNSGDTAYAACAVVQVQGVRLLRPPPGCLSNDMGFVCKPQQRIRNGEEWNINNMELEMDYLTNINKSGTNIHIMYEVYNDCNNRTDKISGEKLIELLYETGINIIGSSVPSEEVAICGSEQTLTRFQHRYTIMKSGLSNWTDVKCYIMLEKKNYLQYSSGVVMQKGSSVSDCSMDGKHTDDFYNVTCNIGYLQKKLAIDLFIDIEVLPNMIGKSLQRSEGVPVTSQLTLKLLEYESISKNVTSRLVRKTASVPVWVIIISLLFGIVILLIIGCVLYKYNCFERQHKKKLEDKKRSQKSNRKGDSVTDEDGTYKTLQEHDFNIVYDEHNVEIEENNVETEENDVEPFKEDIVVTKLIDTE